MHMKRLLLSSVLFLSLSAFAQKSSSDFIYSNLKLSSASFDGKITATVTVTNSGKVAGKDVVQLSLSASSNNVDSSSEELLAFAKTNLLQPGKSQSIKFTLSATDIASFDTETASWVAEAGNYIVTIGSPSNKLSATFSVAKNIVVDRDDRALPLPKNVNEDKTHTAGMIYDLNGFGAMER